MIDIEPEQPRPEPLSGKDEQSSAGTRPVEPEAAVADDDVQDCADDRLAEGDEDSWRRLRYEYEHGTEAVIKLQELYKVSKDRLYRRMAHEGWAQRRSAADPRSRQPVSAQPFAALEKRAELAARLFHTLEEHIIAIEAESLAHDASHVERDAKALTAMARALDQLSDMLEQADRLADEKRTTTAKTEDKEIDNDAFRHLLAERLDRLSEAEDEPADSGQAEQ